MRFPQIMCIDERDVSDEERQRAEVLIVRMISIILVLSLFSSGVFLGANYDER
jgi:hypothetical protein